jgi:plastocyanin
MKRLSILGAAVLLALAGCGGSSNSSTSTASSGGSSTGAASGGAASGGGGGQQLTLQADPSQLKFNTNKLTAKAGKVTITMTNPSPLQHDIALKGGVNAKGAVVGQGGKSTLTVTLKPGKYTFYCSVDSHESAGMNGELDVS